MVSNYGPQPELFERARNLLMTAHSDDRETIIVVIRAMLRKVDFEAALENLGRGHEEAKMDIMDILKKEIQEEEYEILRQQAEDARQEVERVRQEERERARQARRQLLTTLLEDRFGPLPDELRARIVAADADTLDRWTRKVGRASDLNSVFG